MLLKSGDESYQTISGFTLTLAASAQLLSAVAAGMVIETCTKTRAAEIAPSPENPLDEEVKAHEDAAEEHKKLVAKATAWKRVPWLVRILLLLAALSAQVATILCVFYDDSVRYSTSVPNMSFAAGLWVLAIGVWNQLKLPLTCHSRRSTTILLKW